MELKKYYKLSLNYYRIILALTIPFYIVLYGASGHKFRFNKQDFTWMVVIIGSIIVTSIYSSLKSRKGNISLIIKSITLIFLLITFFGGCYTVWSEINFEYGSDIPYLIRVLFFVIPVAFIVANALIFKSVYED